MHAAGAEVIADFIEAVVFAIFLREGLYDADAGEHSREHAGLFAARIPVAVVFWVHTFPKEPAAEDDERGRYERIHRELWVEGHQHHTHRGDLYDLQEEAAGNLVQ